MPGAGLNLMNTRSLRPLINIVLFLTALVPLRAAVLQSVYHGDYNGVLTELAADGTIVATRNLGAGVIGGLTRDAAGNLYAATWAGGVGGVAGIVKISTGGTISTYATLGFGLDPHKLSFASNGDLLVNVNSGKILRVTPSGGVSEFATGLNNPIGMAFAANGDLYVSNLDNTIRRFPLGANPSGGIGEIFASGISSPRELDFDSAGNLYVASGGTLFRYTPGGIRSIFASGFTDLNAVGVAANGDVWVGDYSTQLVSRFSSAGVFLSATLAGPSSTLVANVASNLAPSAVPDSGPISLLLGLGLLSLGLVARGGENRKR